ncbi:MAG TPA: YchE family NAAT transporter [Gammaproteobacteria bacterium]|nr:YchE family NAAT transporter [Gammaproteobacteria bacterium]
METWAEYLKFFVGLIAVLNPIGAIPLFIAMTHNETDRQRRRTASVAGLTVCVVLLVSLLIGEELLRFFGISIPSFRVVGGILIFMMALAMLQAKLSPVRQTEEETREGTEKESVGIVPLGLPLLAGPGSISTVILHGANGGTALHYAVLCAGIVIVSVLVWLSLRAAPLLVAMLGRTGINVFTRIMGLIMAAIGVEFVVQGVRQLLPGLA